MPLVSTPAHAASLVHVCRAELVADGFASKVALGLARWLQRQLSSTASTLADRLAAMQGRRGGAVGAAGIKFTRGPKPRTTDVSFGDVTLRVSDDALERLRRMWVETRRRANGGMLAAVGKTKKRRRQKDGEAHHQRAGGRKKREDVDHEEMEDEDEEDDEEEGMPHVGRLEVEEEEQFRSDLLVLLLRYQSLDGGGFQCALPPPVFSRLKSLWGVEFEGFASPLNASLGAGRYCSAFADTDAPFGSLGSFFSLRTPLSGSYQQPAP